MWIQSLFSYIPSFPSCFKAVAFAIAEAVSSRYRFFICVRACELRHRMELVAGKFPSFRISDTLLYFISIRFSLVHHGSHYAVFRRLTPSGISLYRGEFKH
jgi:hypothetical protein